MNRLSPEATRIFQLAREADNPDATEVDRVGRALAQRIATGGALATGTALLSHSAHATVGISVSKIVTAVALASTISATCFFVMHPRKHPVTSTASVISSSLVPKRVQPPDVASAGPSELPSAVSGSNPVPSAKRSAASRPLPRVAAETRDQLQAETADLHQAQAALRSGDGASALRLLDAQDARYGASLLQQERAAARVLALCQSGNVKAARAESARFEKRWPNSPLASRVQSACAATGGP